MRLLDLLSPLKSQYKRPRNRRVGTVPAQFKSGLEERSLLSRDGYEM